MKKDLTNSKVERSNILNNNIAMPELYKAIGYKGLKFESKFRFTKNQLEYFYEVDSRTIERLLVAHENEISKSGYEVLTGERLKDFKKLIQIENVNIYNNINTA
ncbi:MAG: DNA-binding protein, partial [Chryseobacterium sp.]|nr:DNA-binding protein [Candidatus Chryseobacterium enterohippi]